MGSCCQGFPKRVQSEAGARQGLQREVFEQQLKKRNFESKAEEPERPEENQNRVSGELVQRQFENLNTAYSEEKEWSVCVYSIYRSIITLPIKFVSFYIQQLLSIKYMFKQVPTATLYSYYSNHGHVRCYIPFVFYGNARGILPTYTGRKAQNHIK